jgi:prepilin-type N-terminal cleavage/methylation domain-containing protein
MNIQKGFTLIELLVTITIISIMAGVSIPSFFQMLRRSRFETEAQTIVETILEVRDAALSGQACETNPPYVFNTQKPISNQIKFCLSDLDLQYSQLISAGENPISIRFGGDPFQMILWGAAQPLGVTRSYYTIESNFDETVWTVCLNAVKGFPELHTQQCDCYETIEDSTIPDC